MGADLHFTTFETVAGWCGIAWKDAAILRFTLPVRNEAGSAALIGRRLPDATRAPSPPAVEATIDSARRYFSGETVDFADAAVDLGLQEPFDLRVYDAVRRIRWGETLTYGAVAKELGAGPEGARDVGRAMANNPVPLIVPCHRVLAAGNKIGGFSAPGGSETKRRMLEMEGVHLPPPAPVQQSLDL